MGLMEASLLFGERIVKIHTSNHFSDIFRSILALPLRISE